MRNLNLTPFESPNAARTVSANTAPTVQDAPPFTAGRNVQASVKDGVLWLAVDLRTVVGPSKTGKTTIVGTTSGFTRLGEFQIGLNVTK
jgi:hypothetical protein